MSDKEPDRFYDQRVTYSVDGRGYSADPKQIAMAAARMQRDGWSLKRIRTELSLGEWVTDDVLQAALKTGRKWLDEAIAAGEQPAESVIDVAALIEADEVVYDDGEPKSPKIWTPGSDV